MSSLGRLLKKPQTSDYQPLTVNTNIKLSKNVLLVSLVAQYVYIHICKLQTYKYIYTLHCNHITKFLCPSWRNSLKVWNWKQHHTKYITGSFHSPSHKPKKKSQGSEELGLFMTNQVPIGYGFHPTSVGVPAPPPKKKQWSPKSSWGRNPPITKPVHYLWLKSRSSSKWIKPLVDWSSHQEVSISRSLTHKFPKMLPFHHQSSCPG